MATNYNPVVPTSNLLIAYDFGNSRSYPGSGTTLTDLTGQGRNASITNAGGGSYSYSSNNGGYLSSTYAYAGVNIGNASYTSLSFTGWFYFGGTSSYTGIVCNRGGGGNVTGMGFSQSGNALGYNWNDDVNTYNYNSSGLTLPTNAWCFCGLAVSPSTALFYLNGNSSTRAYTHASTTVGANLNIFADSSIGRYLTGRIATAAMYSTALSVSDFDRHYNALRGRFGL